MRDGLAVLPWSGPLFLLAIFALSALPPFGVFRSEFEIVAGGLGSGRYAAAAILVVLVTVAFLGLVTGATRMLLTPPPPAGVGPAEDPGPADGEPSTWMVIPVLAGLVLLVVLGVHPPADLTTLITHAAAELRGAP